MTELTEEPIAVTGTAVKSLDEAHAAYLQARAAYETHAGGRTPYNSPDSERLQAELRKLGEASDRALDALLRMPAPDVAGIALKLDTYTREYADCPIDAQRLALVTDDARRLAGVA